MIYRPDYIKAVKPFINQPIVKILSGVRRCGKSTIFGRIHDELLKEGVKEEDIIRKRYTEMDIPSDITAKQRYDDLLERRNGRKHCYLLLDEVQEVPNWEKAVNSLLEGSNADIYVTGSNSKLRSSEISTYLTGRYVQIPVYTLSFREFLENKIDIAPQSGIEVDPAEISPALKGHQRVCVLWALRGGRRGLFARFGLGKTVMQLEWCRILQKHIGGQTLIVMPLNVMPEFRADAVHLLGLDEPPYCRTMAEVKACQAPIILTNYERVRDGDIDPHYFTAVSLDEAATLRSFGSKTYQ